MADLFINREDDHFLSLLLEKQRPFTQLYQDDIAYRSNISVEQRTVVPVERNYIGERIQYLLELQGADIASFCRFAGISRSTMHRYLKGTHLPSKKNLLNIIFSLGMSAESFARYPENFEQWKQSLTSRRESKNIFDMCDDFRRQLDRYDITYMTVYGKEKKLPHKHYETFCKLFDDAVELLRLTLND